MQSDDILPQDSVKQQDGEISSFAVHSKLSQDTFLGLHLEDTTKGPRDIKIPISGHKMQSDSDVPQDSVKERDRELRSSDYSLVQSELSQDSIQGKCYISNINISI